MDTHCNKTVSSACENMLHTDYGNTITEYYLENIVRYKFKMNTCKRSFVGCRVKVNCSTVGPGPMGGCPLWGSF